eukprot:366110-Chlamydomonas_euryale.AAC.3
MVGRGEYYRLLTAAFLHGGPLHLLANCLSLHWVAPAVEEQCGRSTFVSAVWGEGGLRCTRGFPTAVGRSKFVSVGRWKGIIVARILGASAFVQAQKVCDRDVWGGGRREDRALPATKSTANCCPKGTHLRVVCRLCWHGAPAHGAVLWRAGRRVR